jgi:hypothetical protein
MTSAIRALLQAIEAHLEREQTHVHGARLQEVEHLLEAIRTALAEDGELEGNAP